MKSIAKGLPELQVTDFPYSHRYADDFHSICPPQKPFVHLRQLPICHIPLAILMIALQTAPPRCLLLTPKLSISAIPLAILITSLQIVLPDTDMFFDTNYTTRRTQKTIYGNKNLLKRVCGKPMTTFVFCYALCQRTYRYLAYITSRRSEEREVM